MVEGYKASFPNPISYRENEISWPSQFKLNKHILLKSRGESWGPELTRYMALVFPCGVELIQL